MERSNKGKQADKDTDQAGIEVGIEAGIEVHVEAGIEADVEEARMQDEARTQDGARTQDEVRMQDGARGAWAAADRVVPVVRQVAGPSKDEVGVMSQSFEGSTRHETMKLLRYVVFPQRDTPHRVQPFWLYLPGFF